VHLLAILRCTNFLHLAFYASDSPPYIGQCLQNGFLLVVYVASLSSKKVLMLKLQLQIKILKGALWYYISCVSLCQNILVISAVWLLFCVLAICGVFLFRLKYECVISMCIIGLYIWKGYICLPLFSESCVGSILMEFKFAKRLSLFTRI
jgi:hypothetical protein